MIHICICEEKCTRRLILQLKGHARAGKEGQDLVCAAASILTYTAAQFFSYLYAEGKLDCVPELRLEQGDSYLSALPKEEFADEALHGLYVLCLGYELLAKQYPENLRLKAFGNG